jgi:thiol-disulfide isomerase/thioredoxin
MSVMFAPAHRSSRPRWRWLVLPAMAAVLAVVTACGGQDAPSAAGTPPSAAGAGQGAAASFTATAADGREIPVPGDKPTVLYFYSASCGSCIEGARSVAQAQQQAPDAANFVAVALDPGSTQSDIRNFLAAAEATGLAGAPDDDYSLMRAYQVQSVSTAVVLDAAGQTVYTGVEPTADQLSAAVGKAAQA